MLEVVAISDLGSALVGRSPQMGTLSSARLLAAVGALALLLTPGAGGVASADPDLSPVINTTCNYSQVVSALNAQSPVAAAALSASPMGQDFLSAFLASSPDQRRQIARELQSRPESQPYVQQYIGVILQVANTCNNF